MLGIRVGGIEPHAIVAASFVTILEVFDPIQHSAVSTKVKASSVIKMPGVSSPIWS